MILHHSLSLISKIIYEIFLIVLSILFSLTFLLIAPYILFLRSFVIICAKLYRPDLGTILSGLDILYGKNFQNWHTNPNEIIVMTSVQEKSDDFLEQSINFFKTVVQNPNYQRLRQYIVPFMGYAFWKDDSDFDLKYHVKYHDENDTFSLNLNVDEKWVNQLKKSKINAPFGKYKSPWEFIIIPNYKYQSKSSSSTAKYSYVIWRFQHSLGDGLSFRELHYKMAKNLIVTDELDIRMPKMNLISKFVRTVVVILRAPYDIVKTLIEVNDRDTSPWCTKPNRFTGVISYGKSMPIPVDFLKSIRRKYNVSYVSVILYGVTVIFRNSMLARGVTIPKVIHCLLPMPIPKHPKGRLCNHMTLVFFPLPVGADDSVERLRGIEANYQSLKSSTLPFSTILAFKLLALFPYRVVQNAEQFVTLMATILPTSCDCQDVFGSQYMGKGFSLSAPAPKLHSGFCISSMTNYGFTTFEVCADSSLIKTDTMAEYLVQAMKNGFLALENDERILAET